ncbi:MAG: class I SAM-dependent methyltransferase [Ignavibacteriales bacterium]|nr:class I SAM-dependent methyltransferase [Ignavibacteriales bacterium]
MPPRDFERLDFASNYRSGNPVIRFLLSRFYKRLETLINSLLGNLASILEVGSGEGYSTSIISNLIRDRGIALFTSDLVPELVSRNRERSGENRLLVQDITELAVKSKKVDMAIALEVLEHLPEPEIGVKELARVARCHVLVSVPFEPWWRLGNIARGAYLRDLGNTPDHLNHWGKKGLRRLLEREFTNVKIYTTFPWLLAVCTHIQPE